MILLAFIALSRTIFEIPFQHIGIELLSHKISFAIVHFEVFRNKSKTLTFFHLEFFNISENNQLNQKQHEFQPTILANSVHKIERV